MANMAGVTYKNSNLRRNPYNLDTFLPNALKLSYCSPKIDSTHILCAPLDVSELINRTPPITQWQVPLLGRLRRNDNSLNEVTMLNVM